MSPPVSSPSPVGILIANRYRLLRRIGQGGMAEVWVADDVELDRQVAIKWLKPVLAADPTIAERFRREAVAVARVSHPNIVPIYDVVAHEGRQVVVMELIDGKSLRQVLDGQKRLSPELTVHIGAQIASALDAAHRAGLVHRDVKPGNIMVYPNGNALLTDFGIAKEVRGDGVLGEDLTTDNVMMGTAKYLSPELVRGKRLDGRADLYSLGLVLYECLAGRVPFLGESDADTALARLQRDPTDLGQLRPTLPIPLINLIHTTLNRNPAHRPQTGAELADALDAVDLSRPVIDKTPAEPRPRRDTRPSVATTPTVPIPGEPHITAQVAQITKSTPPPTPKAAVRREDVTPPAPRPIHGRPARRDEHRNGPALAVVASLVAIAAILVAVLFVIARDNTKTGTPAAPAVTAPGTVSATTTPGVVAPPAGTEPAGSAAPAGSGSVAKNHGIVSVTAWDPFGTNGGENDKLAAAAMVDDDPSTNWVTECYSNRFMAGKKGVGVVIDLGEETPGILRFNVGTAPYQVQMYGALGDAPPSDFSGWTEVGELHFDENPTRVKQFYVQPTRFILIWLKEIGTDPGCTADNPNRGQIGEISFQAGTV